MIHVPIRHTVEPHRRLVVTEGHGVLNETDLISAQVELREHPGFSPDYDGLVDIRGVTGFDVRTEVLGQLARNTAFGPGSRRAFVVSEGLSYGLTRMFEQQSEESGHQMRIFTNLAEARRWLGISPEALGSEAEPDPGPQ